MSDEVENLLKDKGLHYRTQGQDFIIKCLNPDHEDTNPSMRIDKIKGIGQCFSCGFSTNIFRHYGILTNHVSIKIALLKEKLRAIQANTDGLPMLENPVMYHNDYRGISSKTYEHFGAFSTDSVKELEDRLVFPLRDVAGKIRAYVGRHILSDANPRYVNYPSKCKMPLFPAKLEQPSDYLVIVEGIFDMLNLYDKGLTNVAAAMGTQTIQTDVAHKLLPYKSQGVSNIFIMFDGDYAGNTAAEKLKPILENLEYTVEIIPVEKDKDPGDMTQQEVDGIKEYIEKQLIGGSSAKNSTYRQSAESE